MKIDLKDLFKQLPHTSTNDLQSLLAATERELELRKHKDLVKYVPDVIDSSLRDDVLKDCDSLNLSDSLRKASSQWLSLSNQPYVFPDTNPVHHAKDITLFPAISKVMTLINARFNASHDSCLILKYCTSSTTTSLHSDDEDCLDHTEPISNLTVGSSRVIEFVTQKAKKPVCQIEMKDRGLVLMKPGTQDALLHMVRGDSKKTPALRYSLSFRTLRKKSNLSSATMPPSSDNAASITVQQPPPRHICLIAGDSYANRLDVDRLGKKRVNVENIARGGAQLHHVIGQVKAFAAANPNTVVDKLCLSVGTNDIRYCKSIGDLRPKLKSLCSYIEELYPGCKVFFQLLIPLPCLHKNDWVTNRKVLDFNRVLVNECTYRKFYVLDAFKVFCSPSYNPWSPEIRNSKLFDGTDIHPSKSRGMGALAKLYLKAIHSKHFDPFIMQ